MLLDLAVSKKTAAPTKVKGNPKNIAMKKTSEPMLAETPKLKFLYKKAVITL
jgi:hypothetical protein